MTKKLQLRFIHKLFLLFALLWSFSIAQVSNVTSGLSYGTIQNAINAAVSFDIIDITPDVYNEVLTINTVSNLTLRSKDSNTPGSVVIDAGAAPTAIQVGPAAGGMTFQNIKVINASSGVDLSGDYGNYLFEGMIFKNLTDTGILIHNGVDNQNFTILNSVFSNIGYGATSAAAVYLGLSVSNVQIISNTFKQIGDDNSDAAILAEPAHEVIIAFNRFINVQNGVVANSSTEIGVERNLFVQNQGEAIRFTGVSNTSQNILNNTISGGQNGIYLDQSQVSQIDLNIIQNMNSKALAVYNSGGNANFNLYFNNTTHYFDDYTGTFFTDISEEHTNSNPMLSGPDYTISSASSRAVDYNYSSGHFYVPYQGGDHDAGWIESSFTFVDPNAFSLQVSLPELNSSFNLFDLAHYSDFFNSEILNTEVEVDRTYKFNELLYSAYYTNNAQMFDVVSNNSFDILANTYVIQSKSSPMYGPISVPFTGTTVDVSALQVNKPGLKVYLTIYDTDLSTPVTGFTAINVYGAYVKTNVSYYHNGNSYVEQTNTDGFVKNNNLLFTGTEVTPGAPFLHNVEINFTDFTAYTNAVEYNSGNVGFYVDFIKDGKTVTSHFSISPDVIIYNDMSMEPVFSSIHALKEIDGVNSAPPIFVPDTTLNSVSFQVPNISNFVDVRIPGKEERNGFNVYRWDGENIFNGSYFPANTFTTNILTYDEPLSNVAIVSYNDYDLAGSYSFYANLSEIGTVDFSSPPAINEVRLSMYFHSNDFFSEIVPDSVRLYDRNDNFVANATPSTTITGVYESYYLQIDKAQLETASDFFESHLKLEYDYEGETHQAYLEHYLLDAYTGFSAFAINHEYESSYCCGGGESGGDDGPGGVPVGEINSNASTLTVNYDYTGSQWAADKLVRFMAFAERPDENGDVYMQGISFGGGSNQSDTLVIPGIDASPVYLYAELSSALGEPDFENGDTVPYSFYNNRPTPYGDPIVINDTNFGANTSVNFTLDDSFLASSNWNPWDDSFKDGNYEELNLHPPLTLSLSLSGPAPDAVGQANATAVITTFDPYSYSGEGEQETVPITWTGSAYTLVDGISNLISVDAVVIPHASAGPQVLELAYDFSDELRSYESDTNYYLGWDTSVYPDTPWNLGESLILTLTEELSTWVDGAYIKARLFDATGTPVTGNSYAMAALDSFDGEPISLAQATAAGNELVLGPLPVGISEDLLFAAGNDNIGETREYMSGFDLLSGVTNLINLTLVDPSVDKVTLSGTVQLPAEMLSGMSYGEITFEGLWYQGTMSVRTNINSDGSYSVELPKGVYATDFRFDMTNDGMFVSEWPGETIFASFNQNKDFDLQNLGNLAFVKVVLKDSTGPLANQRVRMAFDIFNPFQGHMRWEEMETNPYGEVMMYLPEGTWPVLIAPDTDDSATATFAPVKTSIVASVSSPYHTVNLSRKSVSTITMNMKYPDGSTVNHGIEGRIIQVTDEYSFELGSGDLESNPFITKLGNGEYAFILEPSYDSVNNQMYPTVHQELTVNGDSSITINLANPVTASGTYSAYTDFANDSLTAMLYPQGVSWLNGSPVQIAKVSPIDGSFELKNLNPNMTYDVYIISWTRGLQVLSSGKAISLNATGNTDLSAYLVPELELTAGEWQMFSVPYALSSESADPDVFFTQEGQAIDATPVYTYDASLGDYTFPTNIQSGRSYWVKTTTAQQLSLPTNGVSEVSLSTAFSQTINSGWNMLATPFKFSLDSGLIRVNDGSGTKIFSEAVNAGWLESPKYVWKGEGEGYLNIENPDPWSGYWLWANKELTLELEPKLSSTSDQNDFDEIQYHGYFSLASESFSESDFLLQLTAESGIVKDQNILIGTHAEAADGLERFDNHKAPAFKNYLSGAIMESGHRLANSIKQSDSERKTWNLRMRSDAMGASLSLTPNFIETSSSLKYYIQNLSTGDIEELQHGNSIQYATGGREEINFILYALPLNDADDFVKPLSVVEHYAYPSPAQTETTFRLETRGAKPSTVLVEVFSMEGGRVFGGELLETAVNVHELKWDLSYKSSTVPTGQYQYKISAIDYSGENQIVEMGTIMVVR